MHGESYSSWSMCLSVKSHLTSGASVHPENTVMYSSRNGGQNFLGFSLIQHCSFESHMYGWPFSCEKRACMRIIVNTT